MIACNHVAWITKFYPHGSDIKKLPFDAQLQQLIMKYIPFSIGTVVLCDSWCFLLHKVTEIEKSRTKSPLIRSLTINAILWKFWIFFKKILTKWIVAPFLQHIHQQKTKIKMNQIIVNQWKFKRCQYFIFCWNLCGKTNVSLIACNQQYHTLWQMLSFSAKNIKGIFQ